MNKLSKSMTGIAGEYFAAAELSLRGFMASITLRNNDSIDILACRQSDLKTFAIQVKTIQSGLKKWPLNKKAEILHSEKHFYVFVALNGEDKRPDFYIVPSKELAANISSQHNNWLTTPGRNGQKHNDNDIRVFKENVDQYLEKWDLLQEV